MKFACRLYRYDLGLVEPVQVRGHTLDRREGLLIHIASDTGDEGWGDIAPLPGYSRETLPEALAQARVACVKLEADAEDPSPALAPLPPSVRFGFDSALMMLGASLHDTNPGTWMGNESGLAVVNALLAGATDTCVAQAQAAAAAGFHTFKLKVGQGTMETQVERIRRVAEALPRKAVLRLDANQAWSLEEAREIARGLPGFLPAYVEEPLADPAQLARFYEATGWAVALDETLQGRPPGQVWPEIPGEVAWVIKPSLMRTLEDVLEWQQRAYDSGRMAVISAAYESGVGIRMLAEIAGRMTDWPAGLDTYRYLAADVFEPRLSMDQGYLDLHEARTLAVQPTHLTRVA